MGIRQRVIGAQSLACAQSWFNLGALYDNSHSYKKAESCYLKSLEIRALHVEKSNTLYLETINGLAHVFQKTGRTDKALLLTEELLASENKPSLLRASLLNNAASTYRQLGDLNKSENLYNEAFYIRKKLLGTEHPQYAGTLENLATLYSEMGRMAESEKLYLEAVSLKEKAYGKEHLSYASSLNNLGCLYLNNGDFEKAEKCFIESTQLREKMAGKKNFAYGQSMATLGRLATQTGQFGKAEAHLLEAGAIFRETVGEQHFEFIANLDGLAQLFELSGNTAGSEKTWSQVFGLKFDQLLASTQFLNERELGIYLHTYQYGLESVLSFGLSRISRGAGLGRLPNLYFDNALFHKNFLLYSLKWSALTHAANPQLAEQSVRLKSFRGQIAAELSKPVSERKNFDELQTKADSLEKILVRSVAGFAESRKQVNWQEVQQNLKANEAAVEFVNFDFYNPERTDSNLYAALVLRPGDAAPAFIPLFEKRDLTAVLSNAKSSNYLKINDLYTQKNLYQLIWQPLEPYLKGIEKIHCSPAGLLHQVNLGAIAVDGNGTFADRHALAIVGSTRQLVVDFHPQTTSTNDAYLAGGIRYSMDSMAIATANSSRSRGLPDAGELTFLADSTTRGENWGFLPETAREVLTINELFKKTGIAAQLDTGFVATEEAFRSLGQAGPSPRIVHVSTHGFFFPEPKSRANSTMGGEPVFKVSEHPMIRTGLILAGGNNAWAGQKTPDGLQDGILTAYEISQMNLAGTELVVLSACETGLGDIEGNDGVYGLQRAFKIAGAKYLIMSLWKVNDQTTRELMTAFYEEWLEKKQPIPDAFRAAQAAMRAKYPGAPFHWAGFVLVE